MATNFYRVQLIATLMNLTTAEIRKIAESEGVDLKGTSSYNKLKLATFITDRIIP